jgi:4-coumarate--CoA ligase
MPSESTYPSLPIPDVDIWGFLFERKDKPFGDDKGKPKHLFFEPHVSATLTRSNSDIF